MRPTMPPKIKQVEWDTPDLDCLRDDLRHQIGTPDELDWDYFVETAIMARDAANRENRNCNNR